MSEQGFIKGQSDNLPEVDAMMVADFFSCSLFTSTEMRGVKAKRAERESYGDAAVGYVQLKRTNNICTVMCKICPEHKIKSKNYTVILEVDELAGKILRAECQDCAASAGGCKHAIAFVMWIHRRSEEPSPTEVESYWKRPKLSGVGTSLKFLTVQDFGCKENVPTADINKSLLKKFIKEGLRAGASSQVLKHHSQDKMLSLGIHQLLCSWDCKKTADQFLSFASSQMQTNDCVEAFLKTQSQNKSSLWHELRYGRITASKIYEVSRCKTSEGTLVESIIGGYKSYDTPAMQRGRLLEESVLATLGKTLGKNIQRAGIMLSPQYPVFGASPDGFCDDCVYEVKCPFSEKNVVNYIKADNTVANKFFAQIQMQMLFMKRTQGIFCVADPKFEQNKKLNIVRVNFDEQFIVQLLESALLFWKKNIFTVLNTTS